LDFFPNEVFAGFAPCQLIKRYPFWLTSFSRIGAADVLLAHIWLATAVPSFADEMVGAARWDEILDSRVVLTELWP
jgi:hypothetical protein